MRIANLLTESLHGSRGSTSSGYEHHYTLNQQRCRQETLAYHMITIGRRAGGQADVVKMDSLDEQPACHKVTTFTQEQL